MKPVCVALAALAASFALSAQAVGRLADLSIFDRATGRELPVHWHEGRAYVVGKPGNEYQVVVRNRSQEDLLTVVSVDGVNVVNGETANPRQSGYVLEPWRETRISGWRKSLAEVAAFYFTSLPDSYAGRTGRPDNVGVIGVAVFQRREPPPPVSVAPWEPWRSKSEAWGEGQRQQKLNADAAAPRAEPPMAQAGTAERDASGLAKRADAGAPLGTGHGRRETSPVRHVDFERRTREPVETIAIYYDSYRNLVARGVLATPIGRRDPNPFPTRFTPDP